MLEIDVERPPNDILADWHIRRPEGPGTLELTEQRDRVWLTVKPHWDAGWAEALARKLTS